MSSLRLRQRFPARFPSGVFGGGNATPERGRAWGRGGSAPTEGVGVYQFSIGQPLGKWKKNIGKPWENGDLPSNNQLLTMEHTIYNGNYFDWDLLMIRWGDQIWRTSRIENETSPSQTSWDMLGWWLVGEYITILANNRGWLQGMNAAQPLLVD